MPTRTAGSRSKNTPGGKCTVRVLVAWLFQSPSKDVGSLAVECQADFGGRRPRCEICRRWVGARGPPATVKLCFQAIPQAMCQGLDDEQERWTMKTRIGLVLVLAAGCCAALVGSSRPSCPTATWSRRRSGRLRRTGCVSAAVLASAAVSAAVVWPTCFAARTCGRTWNCSTTRSRNCRSWPRDAAEKMRDLFSGLRDIPQEQRVRRCESCSRSKFQQETEAEIGKILLPHQMKRAKQLAVQLRMRGGRGMLGDQVAQDLGLTEDQKEKLRAKSEQLEEEIRKKTRRVADAGSKRTAQAADARTASQMERHGGRAV